jgi:hypothetical protein
VSIVGVSLDTASTARPKPAVARRHVVEVAAAGLAGALLAVLMTWPLALRLGADIPQDLGDPLFQAWQVAWIGHAVLEQPLHLYQANMFWPLADTLAFSDALIGYAPLGLAAQHSPHAALVTYDVLFLFAYGLAFLGAYLLARELGVGRAGTVAAGAAFAYAPWRLAQNGHLQVISSGGIPLALALLVRGYRRRNVPLVVGGWLVATWQLTLGFGLGLQLAYLLGVLGALGAVVWWRGRARAAHLGRRIVLASALGACLFVAVGLAQARPYLRVADHHPESERTPAQVASFSPSYAGFLAAPPESLVWGDVTASRRTAPSFTTEHTLFPGLTVVVLAVLGLLGDVFSRLLRIGLGVGVLVCGVLSFGLRDVGGAERYVTPYRLLYEFAPGWDAVRTPGRLNTLTSLGLALLAGAGLTFVLQRVRRRVGGARRRDARMLTAGVAALVVAAILAEGFGPVPHVRVPGVPSAVAAAAAPRLHLPIDFYFGSRYSYWSVGGFPRIVNGTGAFEPTSLSELRTTVERFPDARSVEELRSLGVRTVVLHPDLAAGTPWESTATKPVAGLPLTRTLQDGAVVYRLDARPQN